MGSVDTSDFLQELWVKYFKCSYKNKSEYLLAFLRSLYYSTIKGRNIFQSTLFTNDISGMMRLLIRELLNDLENVCAGDEEVDKGVNDVRKLRVYLQGERGTMILYGIDAMLEKIVSSKEDKVESVRSTVIKIINDAELSNILATTLISVLSLLGNDGCSENCISDVIVLPDSTLSQHFYEQVHRASLSKKTPVHRSSFIQVNISSDESVSNIHRVRKPRHLGAKFAKSNAKIPGKRKSSKKTVITYFFDRLSEAETVDLSPSEIYEPNKDQLSASDGALSCGDVIITLRIITRLFGHMIQIDPTLCTNAISIHLELFNTCCHFLGDYESSTSTNTDQLEQLARELLHNIGITMRLLVVERDNDNSSISNILGHKLIDRLLHAYQFIAEKRTDFFSVIGDINKLIVYVFIIVSKKVLQTGNHILRGIIQLFTSWHVNDGVSIAQWTLNEESSNVDSLNSTDKSKTTFFSQLCTLLTLLNEFSLEPRISNTENRGTGSYSHHSDKFNIVPSSNRKDTAEICCYAMICEVLLNNLIYLLTKDSNVAFINGTKKRVYQQILAYIKSVRFCCSIDIFSYSCQLLQLLVNQQSNTVKTVILRFLQILLEISFEFYKSRDTCDCQYTSRHDISLILRDISNACLPVTKQTSTCPRQCYATTPVDLLHFFDWLARSDDDRMKSLVIEVVVHPILVRLQSYVQNDQSQQYHLIGAAVLSLMPYLNSHWTKDDLRLISNVCSKNPVLQSTLYKCLSIVVLSKQSSSSLSVLETEIKSRIIVFLLSHFNFESLMQSFNSDQFSTEELIKDLHVNVPIWHCFRVLFSYNEEFRRILFDKGGIDCCYLMLKEIIKYIATLTLETVVDEATKSMFSLFESMLCIVVDGNMLKELYVYEGFSCDIIWTQLQHVILINIPVNMQIAKLLMNSIFNCCFRDKWTVKDELYQLRQVFLNSIINISSSSIESDVDSDSGGFDLKQSSSLREGDLESDLEYYDADISSGVTSYDDNLIIEATSTKETLLPFIQRTSVFMTLSYLDEINDHLEINCVLVQILFKVIVAYPMVDNDEIMQDTLELLYNQIKTLPNKNQRLLITDELVEEMLRYINDILIHSERKGLQVTLLKLLVLPGSSWLTSTRLRFLIDFSNKNENLTPEIIQMLIDKASLIGTFQPEISIKFPIDKSAIIERQYLVPELLIDNEMTFEYLVHQPLTDCQWKALDPDSGSVSTGFSVSMWLQMEVKTSGSDRKRNFDYKKNKKKVSRPASTNKKMPILNDVTAVDGADDQDLIHIFTVYSQDKIDHKKILSIQIWCKPSFGTVVVRLYECIESPRAVQLMNKSDSKTGIKHYFPNIFGSSSNHDEQTHDNNNINNNNYNTISESPVSTKYSMIDESIIHGFLTSSSWNFVTVTLNWRSLEAAVVTLLLNGDVKRQTKLTRSPTHRVRSHNAAECFIGLGHVSRSLPINTKQMYSIGRIFLFESPVLVCGNDNLSLMLMTSNWDGGQIMTNQRDETNRLAAVVMSLLVDLQSSTESAALLIERGQYILCNGWQAKMVEYISSHLVGTYSSELPYQFIINTSYNGATTLTNTNYNNDVIKLALKQDRESGVYVLQDPTESYLIVKNTLDSALERLGGISVLIFWLAKFVEKQHDTAIHLLLKLFLILLRKSIFLCYQNRQESGYSLLFQLFKSFRMNIDLDMMTEIISHTMFECPIKSKLPNKRHFSSKLCRDPYLLRDLLLQWKMWATSKALASDEEVKTDPSQSVELDKFMLSQISNLLNEDNIFSNINCSYLGYAGILCPLLQACREPFDTLPTPLPSDICKLIVQIITNFIPTPVDLTIVTNLCNAILHLYQVSMRDCDSEPGKYFKHLRFFSVEKSDWLSISISQDKKSPQKSSNGTEKPIVQEIELSNQIPTFTLQTPNDSCQFSREELRAMKKFYGDTLSNNVSISDDTDLPLKDIEKSDDSVGSDTSSVVTLINDEDEPSVVDQSFETNYLSSGSMEENFVDKLDGDGSNDSSRIDTLVGLISLLENVIQVKISDTILVQLSMENFSFEFIIHMLTHRSPLVRLRCLSLFRVYICQKRFLTQNTALHPHMINIVAYIIHQHPTTIDIVAETVSIIFAQNITGLITDIDWQKSASENEDTIKRDRDLDLDQRDHTLPHIDSKVKLSGMVSINEEQSKSYTSFEDMVNRAGNHMGLTYRRSCVLFLSTLENIESSSMVDALRFCDWLFIQNPSLLQAACKSGLLECVCNICHQMSEAGTRPGNGALRALLGICETISTDITAAASYSQFERLLELCDILYFSGLKLAKQLFEQGPQIILHQYLVHTIIFAAIETISILNNGDPMSKNQTADKRISRKVERLPRKYATQGPALSQKLIKTVSKATHMIINTQEYLFVFFNDLFQTLGLKLVDFIARTISNCLTCSSIPDHFSVYLCAKEVIKNNLGDLIVFLTNPKLDISLRLEVLRGLLKLENIDRVTRYSLLGNSSGSMCLILNLKRVLYDIRESGELSDPIISDISLLLRVISLDFDVEIIKEDNRNLWIQDCSQKLKTWKQKFNEIIKLWHTNADRGLSELLANLKKYQNSYRPHARKNLQKQYNENIRIQRSSEFYRRRSWKTLIANFTQEGAIWCSDCNRAQFMQLDPTEGPCRIRARMVKTTLNLEQKFFTTDLKQCDDHPQQHTLDFLFDSTYAVDRMVFESPIKFQLLRCIENSRLVCSCAWVCQSGTFDGEFFVGPNRIGFMVDNVNSSKNQYDQLPNPLKDYGFVHWKLNEIKWVLKRRFKLRDLALEIFMRDGRNCLIAANSTQERDAMTCCIESFLPPSTYTKPRLIEIQHKWVSGEMTNFEYLTILNTASGRSYNDIMQYPVFPFILKDYSTDVLNLQDNNTFRDLCHPIAVQNVSLREKVAHSFAEKAEVYQTQLNIARMSDDVENMPIWALPPHHYSSLYSNVATVLYYMIRVPPFTQKFIEFQGNHFDCPDRMFHTLESAWDSSTSSMSSVKEIIPEFFYLPEMFTNNQSFNFGERYSGTKVNDVILPKWCNGNARLFCLIHRAALESSRVSMTLNMWIDLIFGYKQTGKAALDAMNLFHPYTYYKAICPDEISDPTRRNAVEQIVENYGQVPKQLFINRPHSSKKNSQKLQKPNNVARGPAKVGLERLSSTSSDDIEPTPLQKDRSSFSVTPNVFGIQWGDWVGSPQSGQTFISTLSSVSYPDARSLFLLPLSKYNRKSHKVLILPLCSDALFLSTTDEDCIPIMKFSATLMKRRMNVSSMTLYHSYNQDLTPEDHGSLFVSLGSGRSIVSSMVVNQRSGRVFFGMDSGLIQVFQGDVNKYSNIPSFLENFGKHWRTLSGHCCTVTHLSIGESFAVLASCDLRTNVAIWDSQRLDLMHYIDWTVVKLVTSSERLSFVNNDFDGLLDCSSSKVFALCFSETLGDLIISRSPSRQPPSLQWQSIVSLFTINGHHVQSIYLPGTVVSLSYTKLPEGRHVNAIAAATSEGRLTVLSSWDLQVVWKIKISTKNSLPDPIIDIQYSHSGKELFLLNKSGHVRVIQSNKTDQTLKQSVYAWL